MERIKECVPGGSCDSRPLLWWIVLVCVLYHLLFDMGWYICPKEDLEDYFADCRGDFAGVQGGLDLVFAEEHGVIVSWRFEVRIGDRTLCTL